MRSLITSGLLAAAALAWAAPAAQAQTNEEKLTAKLAEPFLTKAPWLTDYDKARAEAKASGKLIFAYFSRSYSP